MKLFLACIFAASSVVMAQETSYVESTSAVGVQTDSFDYPSNLKLRQDRKVGAGISVGGALGVAGLIADLNIQEADSAVVGFGTGSGYQSMQFAWKRSFEGEYFTPYTTVGYAHWWDAGSRKDANRSSLLKNFLTDDQKEKNKFGLDLLTGSIGMQYNQLSGELAGSSFFIEFGGLMSFQNTKLMPVGSVGALYYF